MLLLKRNIHTILKQKLDISLESISENKKMYEMNVSEKSSGKEKRGKGGKKREVVLMIDKCERPFR